MTDESARLERALMAWLAHRDRGGDDAELLRAHPDLADLLEPMLAEQTATETASERQLGDYVLQHELGRGGMGIVHKARHRTLGREVAIKVLAPALANDPATLARFRREAMHLSRLRHPNIVDVIGVGETDGQHWLAMAFVDGETLLQRIDALRASGGHRGDSRRQMVAMVAQVAAALAHAHAAGLVHRDVKPANVFVRTDGQALLGDFGLSLGANSATLTRHGVVAGTPDYMSPEQVRDEALDGRSDVFALGVTLYECLTLERPFAASTVAHVLHRIEHAEPRPLRAIDRAIPPDLAAIVGKALEKQRDDRYADAAAFAGDLQAFLELRPIAARPPSRLTRVRRWLRREPWRAAGALGLLGAGVAGCLLLLNLPTIRAAARERDDLAFSTELASSLIAANSAMPDEARHCIERARAMRPDDADAIACDLVLRMHEEEPQAILTRLDALSGAECDVLRRVRVRLLQKLGRSDEADAIASRLPPPRSDMDVLLWIETRRVQLAGAPATELLAEIEQLIRCQPRPNLTLFSQWLSFLPRERRPEAAQAILVHWPDLALAKHLAGFCLLDTEPQRALELQQAAIASGQNNPAAWVDVAIAASKLGHADEARAAIDSALRFPRLNTEVWLSALAVMRTVGDDAQQIAFLRRFVAAQPAEPRAHDFLGQALLGARDKALEAEAVEEFRKAVELAPNDAEQRYDYAVALHVTYHDREAAEQCREALRLAPTDERAHRRLIGALKDLQDPDGILAELERWRTVRPDDAEIHADLARVYLAQEKPLDALRMIERANILSHGTSPEVLEQMAAVHTALGETAAATRCTERATALRATGPAQAK